MNDTYYLLPESEPDYIEMVEPDCAELFWPAILGIVVILILANTKWKGK